MIFDDLHTFDPGIRNTVAFLREHGFYPVDSGDGVSKCEAIDIGEAEDAPHVHMELPSIGRGMEEADRLAALLRDLPNPVPVVSMSMSKDGVSIQLTYDPANRSEILSVYGLNDARLGGPFDY